MTWLNNKVKSDELNVSVRSNTEKGFLFEVGHNSYNNGNNLGLLSGNKNYFEFDDNTTGVDIDGYLFFPKKVSADESFSYREFMRTKIMSGGQFTTRGQYIPKEFSFDTIIDIDPEELDEYTNIFSEMENKVCTITSPYMGGMFKGEVNINVTNPESSPHAIECKVKIKEIPDAMARLKGDPVIQYPSINTISDVAVKEKRIVEEEGESESETNGHEDIYDDYDSSHSSSF